MTPDTALRALGALGDAEKAAQMAAYHKAPRRYLGVSNPELDRLARDWRRDLDIAAQVALSDALWRSDIHEARILAAKLLTRARIRPDDAVWALIRGWVPDFDAWAIADHACMAGAKRLLADPVRLNEVENWTRSHHMWSRRAALVITLPWARMAEPGAADLARRTRILGWAEGYVTDPEWFIQKAVAWWLRDLSRRDPDTMRAFLDRHGAAMKAFARREAARHLPG